jgi:lysylphosphatidylglycerol synthetase-like protein (DUF2156 family)
MKYTTLSDVPKIKISEPVRVNVRRARKAWSALCEQLGVSSRDLSSQVGLYPYQRVFNPRRIRRFVCTQYGRSLAEILGDHILEVQS